MDNIIAGILTKRFQTTMIGALFEFEKEFGYLWGQHKSENEALTDKENRFLDIWEDARNRILNNGNNQLRKCISEVKNFSSTNNGEQYKYNFRVQQERKGSE